MKETMKTSEINPERIEKYKYLDQLHYVPKFIIISACCGFIAGVALILSVLGLFSSTGASAKVDYELQATRAELTATKNKTELYIVFVQDLHAELKAKGFEPPPLPEE